MFSARKLYFDNEEIGLAAETSHPNFRDLIKDSFIYSSSDEFSPFGNDDGWMTLTELEDWYKDTNGRRKITDFLFNHIDDFGFGYDSKRVSLLLEVDQLNEIMGDNDFLINCMDEAIIATAFGQYKIEGLIDYNLKKIALIAIQRQIILNNQIIKKGELDLNKLYQVVEGESTRPNEFGGTLHLTTLYLERLEIMQNYISEFKPK